MRRISAVLLLILLSGCADQSRSSALNECRMTYYLYATAMQQQSIPDCMKVKSFETVPGCSPQRNADDWDEHVWEYPYDNPKCYRPIGIDAWIATSLSPM